LFANGIAQSAGCPDKRVWITMVGDQKYQNNTMRGDTEPHPGIDPETKGRSLSQRATQVAFHNGRVYERNITHAPSIVGVTTQHDAQ
jgi:hypothetical protein